MRFTKEHLNQLYDGELTPTIERQLREAMQADPKLAQQYAELALADVRFIDCVAGIDDVPVPESILMMLTDETEQASKVTNNLQRDSHSTWQRLSGAMAKLPLFHPTVAMAFTFIFIGLVSVFLTLEPFNEQHLSRQDILQAVNYGLVDQQNPVAQILSNSPSGTPQKIEGDEQLVITPVLSFSGATGDYCREYTISAKSASHRAVACFRESNWRVVLSAETYHISQNQYQTASSITPSNFEKRINEIIEGDPLSFKEELTLIQQGWKSNQK